MCIMCIMCVSCVFCVVICVSYVYDMCIMCILCILCIMCCVSCIIYLFSKVSSTVIVHRKFGSAMLHCVCNTLQHTATPCNTLQHTATAHLVALSFENAYRVRLRWLLLLTPLIRGAGVCVCVCMCVCTYENHQISAPGTVSIVNWVVNWLLSNHLFC